MKPPPEITILGIDPGTAITGYGIIEVKGNVLRALDYGCIRTSAKASPSFRYTQIYKGLCELLERFSPDAVAVETQFVHKNVATAIKLGMSRGVAVLAPSLRSIPIFEYAPTRAKKAVVGNGSASKVQVQAMVKALLSLSVLPTPEDASDALALAICHAHTLRHHLHEEFKI